MLFPIGDDNRGWHGPAIVTWGLIAANLFVFFVFQGMGSNAAFTYGWSVIPVELTRGIDLIDTVYVSNGVDRIPIPEAPGPSPIYLTVLSAMFMHGGYLHLFGNMLYLWIFGDNVEHRFGSLVFLSFYLVSGIAATLSQVFVNPDSVVPNLGASGAISGVMGAYLLLFPRNRVRVIVFFFIISVPAVVAIGLWIVMQFVSGYGSIVYSQEALGGVAYAAHIGGFVAGMIMAGILRVIIREEPHNVFSHAPDHWRPHRFR